MQVYLEGGPDDGKIEDVPEVEIIVPEARRLNPAPAERLLNQIIDVEPSTPPDPPPPQPCGHGYIANDCYICDHIAATQRAWFG